MTAPLPTALRIPVYLSILNTPFSPTQYTKYILTCRPRADVTVTQAWTTASLLDTKVELANVASTGVKVDLQNLWNPSKPNSAAQKLNLAFKNPNVHSRAFINYGLANGNLDAVLDVTAGHEGFLVGGEAGYDVQKAAITRYSLGLGYQTPAFTASLVGTQNLSVVAASYYQKVNSSVEVGTKAAYDVQNGKPSGLEVASKYKLDPLTFAKVCKVLFQKLSPPAQATNHAQNHRSRSTTAASPPSPTAPSSTPAPPSASASPSTPPSSTRPATRSAPLSLSRVKRVRFESRRRALHRWGVVGEGGPVQYGR